MLQVRELSCVRGERHLFSGLSFDLGAGELLHVRGDNGAGKTSLLRLLVGLGEPASGTITWQGQAIADRDSDYRVKLAFLGHNTALKADLTALENLAFMAAIAGLQRSDADLRAVLCDMGLSDQIDLPIGWLSAGQKRRVLLAWLKVKHAALWVLDEPFNALDTNGAALLASQIRQHLDHQGLVVVTSHQPLPFNATQEVFL